MYCTILNVKLLNMCSLLFIKKSFSCPHGVIFLIFDSDTFFCHTNVTVFWQHRLSFVRSRDAHRWNGAVTNQCRSMRTILFVLKGRRRPPGSTASELIPTETEYLPRLQTLKTQTYRSIAWKPGINVPVCDKEMPAHMK